MLPANQSRPIATTAEFRTSRRGFVRVSLSEGENGAFFNIRCFLIDGTGAEKPLKKGLAMSVEKLPALAKAMQETVAKATELGLLKEPQR